MRHLFLGALLLPAMAFANDLSSGAQGTPSDEQYLTHFTGDVDGFVGWRHLNNTSYWSPVEHQMAYGVQGDFGLAPYWVRGEAGFDYASKSVELLNPDGTDTGFNFDTTFMDWTLGARVSPASGWFRPYLGAGMIIVDADAKGTVASSSASDSDTNVGFYSHAGLAVVVARHVHIGAEYRLVRGVSMNLFGVQGDANNEQASVFVGYSW